MKILLIILMLGFCLNVYAEENLYIVCSKTDFDIKYKDISSGGENYSLDNAKVQFSNRFTGQQIKELVQDPNVEVYNKKEIGAVLNSPEWKEPLLSYTVTIDAQFKEDYAAITGIANKLDFLETRLGLE